MAFVKNTEAASNYHDLEKMSVLDILTSINKEDQTVALAIQQVISDIEKLIVAVVPKMKAGGRLFYIGAGTSGRLGIVDASECPPTFGVPQGMVVGLIAGGDGAIRKAVEFAEDDFNAAWLDLQNFQPEKNDTIIGIAASGTTPYVVGGLKKAKEQGLTTGCITNNPESPITIYADFPIVINTGAEFLTGSTRMKAGTSQKLVLNMISTTIMIQLGRVKGNKMVDMQLTNAKLVDRGIRMLMELLHIDNDKAAELLYQNGSVRNAVKAFQQTDKP